MFSTKTFCNFWIFCTNKGFKLDFVTLNRFKLSIWVVGKFSNSQTKVLTLSLWWKFRFFSLTLQLACWFICSERQGANKSWKFQILSVSVWEAIYFGLFWVSGLNKITIWYRRDYTQGHFDTFAYWNQGQLYHGWIIRLKWKAENFAVIEKELFLDLYQ